MFIKNVGLAGLLVFCTTTAIAMLESEMSPPQVEAVVHIGLYDLVVDIQEESPAVQAAQAALETAQAKVDSSGLPLYNPTLEMYAEDSGITTATLGISQTIDWANKRQTRHHMAQAEMAAVKSELTVVRQHIAVEVLSNLAQYQMAREQRKLAVSRTRLMEDFAETAKRRQQIGDVSQLDYALARVAYANARMQQGNADAVLISAEAALRGVSGMARNSWPSLPETLPQFPEFIDINSLVIRLPEMVSQWQQVERAKAGIELSKRKLSADPTITIHGGRSDEETLFGLSLEVPLFVRNSFRADVQAASQDALQAEYIFLENRRRAHARLEGAMAGYRVAIAAWRAWDEVGQAGLSEQVNLLEKLWEAGELSATEYLMQASQSVTTQATATELAGRVWLAAIEWLDASGQIEAWLIQTK